ncbi:hypothetical protein J4E05_15985 [Thalassospira sp. NFXS8]|uniref:hypothetical protein n=1 Tax=Thalassospira sp. NFXS8 TaxID=2819093 RepID=UPI0032DFECDC
MNKKGLLPIYGDFIAKHQHYHANAACFPVMAACRLFSNVPNIPNKASNVQKTISRDTNKRTLHPLGSATRRYHKLNSQNAPKTGPPLEIADKAGFFGGIIRILVPILKMKQLQKQTIKDRILPKINANVKQFTFIPGSRF